MLPHLRSAHRAVRTLKRRADFLRVRGGHRWATPTLVVEAKSRCDDGDPGAGEPRFGITVTRKIGNAVARNRVRRRLKAAIGDLGSVARTDFDYVIIARPPAADRVFVDLKADLAQALSRIHGAARRRHSNNEVSSRGSASNGCR